MTLRIDERPVETPAPTQEPDEQVWVLHRGNWFLSTPDEQFVYGFYSPDEAITFRDLWRQNGCPHSQYMIPDRAPLAALLRDLERKGLSGIAFPVPHINPTCIYHRILTNQEARKAKE